MIIRVTQESSVCMCMEGGEAWLRDKELESSGKKEYKESKICRKERRSVRLDCMELPSV